MPILTSLVEFRYNICHEVGSRISCLLSLFLLLFLCHNRFLFLFAPLIDNLIISEVLKVQAALLVLTVIFLGH